MNDLEEMIDGTKGWTDRDRLAAYQGYSYARHCIIREMARDRKIMAEDGAIHDCPLPPKFEWLDLSTEPEPRA